MMIKKMTVLALATLTLLVVTAGRTEAGRKGGWLGVQIETVNEEVRDDWNLNTSKGVLVTRVSSGSPADDSGIKRGDVIVKYEGIKVNDVDQLQEFVRKTPAEEEVSISVNRDGNIKKFTVSIGKVRRFSRNRSDRTHGFRFYTRADGGGYLGIDMYDLTEGLREYFKVEEDEGVLVVNVMEDSPAEKAGFKSGDVITKVGKRIVEDSGDLRKAISRYDADERVVIEYVRNKKKSTKKVKLGEREDYETDQFRIFRPMHKGNRSSLFFDMDEFDLDLNGLEFDMEDLRNELRHLEDELDIDI